jgi:hypothetical protein
MSKFLSELDVSLINNDSIWRLEEPLIYQSDILDCNVVVPKGFSCDFASVPRLPIAFELYGDRAHREGTIHDYLFRKDSIPNVPYMAANRVFYEAMEVRGKPWYVRWPMYLAVCTFSRLCYHRRKVFDKL